MEQIKEIVNKVIEKLASDKTASIQQEWRALQEIVGKKFIKHTMIEGLRDGKLFIRVDSPVLLFHLNLKRSRILEKLQKINKDLKTIDLRMGRVS